MERFINIININSLMQKVWRQIGFKQYYLDFINDLIIKDHFKNESECISTIIMRLQNYERIIKHLEGKAHESEIWKQRAQDRVKEQIVETSKKIDDEDIDNVIENYKKAVVIKE